MRLRNWLFAVLVTGTAEGCASPAQRLVTRDKTRAGAREKIARGPHLLARPHPGQENRKRRPAVRRYRVGQGAGLAGSAIPSRDEADRAAIRVRLTECVRCLLEAFRASTRPVRSNGSAARSPVNARKPARLTRSQKTGGPRRRRPKDCRARGYWEVAAFQSGMASPSRRGVRPGGVAFVRRAEIGIGAAI